MNILLTILRDLSWLSPATGTRLALALLDLYTLPARVHFALGEAIAALQEHNPEHQRQRQWAAQVIRDIVAESRKSETQRKQEAN